MLRHQQRQRAQGGSPHLSQPSNQNSNLNLNLPARPGSAASFAASFASNQPGFNNNNNNNTNNSQNISCDSHTDNCNALSRGGVNSVVQPAYPQFASLRSASAGGGSTGNNSITTTSNGRNSSINSRSMSTSVQCDQTPLGGENFGALRGASPRPGLYPSLGPTRLAQTPAEPLEANLAESVSVMENFMVIWRVLSQSFSLSLVGLLIFHDSGFCLHSTSNSPL